MKYIIIISSLFVFLISCKSSKNVSVNEETSTDRPSWINDRPISSAYYVGIGGASKSASPIDYNAVAKKNALNDLASEIKIVIQGESFLNTLEVNQHFQEEFVSNITTITNEEIEQYELIDSYENGSEYWVYYRLSKSEHERIKAEKKKTLMEEANGLYLNGITSESNGAVGPAIDYYIKALMSIQPYWTETNTYTDSDGQTIYLDHEIYNRLSQMLTNIQLKPSVPRIDLSHFNGYREEVIVTAYNGATRITNLPLTYQFDKGNYERAKQVRTNQSGEILVVVEDVNIKNSENSFKVSVNTGLLIEGTEDEKLAKKIINRSSPSGLTIPIVVEFPKLQIVSEEMKFSEPSNANILGNAFSTELNKLGFTTSSNENEADYKITISSNSTQGGTSQGFHVAFLDFTMIVVNNHTNLEVYRKSLTQVKGLQLNFDAASAEAYKKGKKIIEEDLVEELLKTIL